MKFRRRKILHLITRRLHRLYSGIPVIEEWPGFKRIFGVLISPFQLPVLVRLATRHRNRMTATRFVGVTGSTGKTMTKAMIREVLSTSYQVLAHRGTSNSLEAVARNILETGRTDQFCVLELSASSGDGSLKKPLAMLQPQIGVLTNIGTDHISAYGSQEAIAREKGRLIRELPDDGVAILNADDPNVLQNRDQCRANIITYGTGDSADVRAESISCEWPDRLSFDLVHNGERIKVQTQMCGRQWVQAGLAAAATGIAEGVPLSDIVDGLQSVKPFVGRMSVETLEDGVTFIRDDWKASIKSIEPALEYLGSARNVRKFAVIGTISDYSGDTRRHYVRIAKRALDVADFVVFVGSNASMVLRAQPAEAPDRLKAFGTTKSANDYLSTAIKPGDLVLLKGSNRANHLVRIMLSRKSLVTCWRSDCKRTIFCNSCELFQRDESGNRRQSHPTSRDRSQRAIDLGASITLDKGEGVLVGLGNSGKAYEGTPHNVGSAILDCIAAESSADWHVAGKVSFARTVWRGMPLCLVKPIVPINFSGPALNDFVDQIGATSSHISLIYDDINLPLGKLRVRMRGSDGGHLGVRSILESFQTSDIPRIKIGVRRSDRVETMRKSVLRPFTEAEKPLMDEATRECLSRVAEVVNYDRP